MLNKGTIGGKIFVGHENLPDLRENICFLSNFSLHAHFFLKIFVKMTVFQQFCKKIFCFATIGTRQEQVRAVK
jgi:hypothetical protein